VDVAIGEHPIADDLARIIYFVSFAHVEARSGYRQRVQVNHRPAKCSQIFENVMVVLRADILCGVDLSFCALRGRTFRHCQRGETENPD
jgi:hypothetical protein